MMSSSISAFAGIYHSDIHHVTVTVVTVQHRRVESLELELGPAVFPKILGHEISLSSLEVAKYNACVVGLGGRVDAKFGEAFGAHTSWISPA